MNNNFHNEEIDEKKLNKKIAINSFLILLALLVSFFGTYFITDRLSNSKYTNTNEAIEEKAVYNSTKALDDDMTIVLMTDGVVEKEESIAEFKESNAITSDVTTQFVVNYFSAIGYKLDILEDTKVVFAKESTSVVLEPNKYYIGEKDGYFAIYKTDNNGNLSIESESDIYKNSRPVSFFKGTEDYDDIKNFKACYDTKEEAVQRLSAYLS